MATLSRIAEGPLRAIDVAASGSEAAPWRSVIGVHVTPPECARSGADDLFAAEPHVKSTKPLFQIEARTQHSPKSSRAESPVHVTQGWSEGRTKVGPEPGIPSELPTITSSPSLAREPISHRVVSFGMRAPLVAVAPRLVESAKRPLIPGVVEPFAEMGTIVRGSEPHQFSPSAPRLMPLERWSSPPLTVVARVAPSPGLGEMEGPAEVRRSGRFDGVATSVRPPSPLLAPPALPKHPTLAVPRRFDVIPSDRSPPNSTSSEEKPRPPGPTPATAGALTDKVIAPAKAPRGERASGPLPRAEPATLRAAPAPVPRRDSASPAPRISISVGRVEIHARSAPAPRPSTVHAPLAHQIEPSLPLGLSDGRW